MLKRLRKNSFPFLTTLTLVSCLMMASPSLAATPRDEETAKIISSPEDLDLIDVGIVKEIVTSDRIRLSNDRVYTLDNIRVPAHYEDMAVSYLKGILQGKEVGIFTKAATKDSRTDRLGNKIGHVVTAQAGWVQASLISNGLAYAFTLPESRELIPTLYEYEEQARSQNIGLWQNPLYALKHKNNIGQSIGSFQVFEGVIDDIRPRTETISFIFGKNVPADFVFLIRKENDTSFKKEFPLLTKPGQRVRLHGWIENNNGPAMRISDFSQIEIVTASAPKNKLACAQPDATGACPTEKDTQPEAQAAAPGVH